MNSMSSFVILLYSDLQWYVPDIKMMSSESASGSGFGTSGTSDSGGPSGSGSTAR